jgi:hypothetical protein
VGERVKIDEEQWNRLTKQAVFEEKKKYPPPSAVVFDNSGNKLFSIVACYTSSSLVIRSTSARIKMANANGGRWDKRGILRLGPIDQAKAEQLGKRGRQAVECHCK